MWVYRVMHINFISDVRNFCTLIGNKLNTHRTHSMYAATIFVNNNNNNNAKHAKKIVTSLLLKKCLPTIDSADRITQYKIQHDLHY